MALSQTASTSSVYRNMTAVVVSADRGDLVGESGCSSLSITIVSPIRISACAMFPSGPIIGGIASSAPNADL